MLWAVVTVVLDRVMSEGGSVTVTLKDGKLAFEFIASVPVLPKPEANDGDGGGEPEKEPETAG